jgi:hypothetical protein
MSNKSANQWKTLIMVVIVIFVGTILYRYFNKEIYKEYMDVGPLIENQIDCTLKRDSKPNYVQDNISLGNAKLPSANYFEALDKGR